MITMMEEIGSLVHNKGRVEAPLNPLMVAPLWRAFNFSRERSSNSGQAQRTPLEKIQSSLWNLEQMFNYQRIALAFRFW